MKTYIKNKRFGDIYFVENIWTSDRTIEINGNACKKISKTEFLYETKKQQIKIEVKGNLFTGVKLFMQKEEIQAIESTKWYEYLLVSVCFILGILFGNIPVLHDIFPLLGGVFGILATSIMSFLSILAMKYMKYRGLKIIVGILFIIFEFLVLASLLQLLKIIF